MGKLKKRSDIIIISVVTVIVLTAVIALCVLFCPRKLSNLVDTKEIESIEYYGIDRELIKTFSSDEIAEFSNIVKKSKYTILFDWVLAVTPMYRIQYKDNSYIELSYFKIVICDSVGNKTVKPIEVKLAKS